MFDYFRQRNRGWVLSLFSAVCIVYLPFLGNPFVFDDQSLISGQYERYMHSFFQFELRCFSYASLGWTRQIFSDVLPHPFRLGNLLVHATNVILLFFLLRQLVYAAIPKIETSSTAIWGAWFGALIFACHPVAVYATGYVVERSILMATLFSLVMQLAYLQGLLTGRKRWLLLAVCAYFIAVFSKEHSVMIPALLVAQTIMLRTRIVATKGALGSTLLAVIAISMLVIMRAKGVTGVAYEPLAANSLGQYRIAESSSMLHALSVLTQAGLFFKYLLLWLVPNPAWMSVDMRVEFVHSIFAWQGWLGAIAFTAYGLLGGRLLLRPGWGGLAGLALLYPWLQFMLEFSSIRVQEPFVLYRSYLWIPGMMLFIPMLLSKLQRFRTRVLFGLGLIVILLVPLSWNRLWVFADEYRLWNDAAKLLSDEKETGADRIYYNRGKAELAAQKWEEAIADFQRAEMLSPQLAPIYYILGVALINTKRYQEALDQFDAAIKLKSDDASYYYAKGMSLKRLHQDDLAMRQIEKSCELKNALACTIVQMSFRKK